MPSATEFFSQFTKEDQEDIKAFVERSLLVLHVHGVQRAHIIILNLDPTEIGGVISDEDEGVKERIFLAFLRRFPNLLRIHVKIFTAAKKESWNFVNVIAAVDGDLAGNYLGVTYSEDIVFAGGEIITEESLLERSPSCAEEEDEEDEDAFLNGEEDAMPEKCKTCKDQDSCVVYGTDEEKRAANIAFFHPGSNAIN
jgi:hypothetical protein